MTKTRIRYKNNNGTMVSTTFFTTIKGNAYVHLQPSDLSFKLVDLETNATLDSGTSTSLHLLKKVAKECLMKNGVVFQNEKRERLEAIREELKALGIDNV